MFCHFRLFFLLYFHFPLKISISPLLTYHTWNPFRTFGFITLVRNVWRLLFWYPGCYRMAFYVVLFKHLTLFSPGVLCYMCLTFLPFWSLLGFIDDFETSAVDFTRLWRVVVNWKFTRRRDHWSVLTCVCVCWWAIFSPGPWLQNMPLFLRSFITHWKWIAINWPLRNWGLSMILFLYYCVM